ncbi:MAG: HD domain-containing protein [Bacillota bacterium]|nr:HD domain-containing protein [Bacillota bacterium]
MKVFISNFRVNEPVDTALMVAEKRLVPFRDQAKGRYLALVLVDRTGQIEGRAWENAEELANGCEVGDVIQVTGVVEEYREVRQLRLTSLRRLTESEIDLGEFLAVTPRDRQAMEERLDALIASVRHPGLRALLTAFFGDPQFRRAYSEAPAAKRVHHNYLGGLLEHSLEVAELVEAVARFAPEAEGGLNRDLALTGALLHDIGKVREYRYRPLIDLTDEGKLLGHTVLGCAMVRERAAALGPEVVAPEVVLELEHLLLTHHGELEWGAPVLPQTVEAAALHYADLLSGRVKQYQQVAAGASPGEGGGRIAGLWSPYDGVLGRSLYLGQR